MSGLRPNKSVNAEFVKELFNISAAVATLAELLTDIFCQILPRGGFMR